MEIYSKIQAAGVPDPAFHWGSFQKQTVDLIQGILTEISSRERRIANYHSITIARIGLGFSGEGSKITMQDLLPFVLEGSDPNRLDGETLEILRGLISSGKIPPKVISAFSPFLKQLQ